MELSSRSRILDWARAHPLVVRPVAWAMAAMFVATLASW